MGSIDSEVNRVLCPIADALLVDLTVKGTEVKSAKHNLALEGLVPNSLLPMDMTLVEQIVDANAMTACLVLRVSGNLFVCVVCDEELDMLTVILVNGTPLGWLSDLRKFGRVRIFGAYWSRKTLLQRVHDGVKAVFAKRLNDQQWTYLGGADLVEKYLDSRKTGSSSALAREDLYRRMAS